MSFSYFESGHCPLWIFALVLRRVFRQDVSYSAPFLACICLRMGREEEPASGVG